MTTPAPAPISAVLAAYLPRIQLRLLSEEQLREGEPWVRSFPAAVLMVDLSGFSELTRQFEERGKAGAEELSGILARHFGWLTDAITQHGGDVISFAGDAALAVWPAMDGSQLPSRVAACARAALAIQRKMASEVPVRGVSLKQRSAIAAGELHALRLGGSAGKYQFLVAGEPLREAGVALHEVEVGSVAVAGAAAASSGEVLLGHKLSSGLMLLRDVRAAEQTQDLREAVEPQPAPVSLSDYLPAFIVDRVAAGLGNWLAEFRNVTVLFVGFPNVDASRAEELLKLHPAIQNVQNLLLRFEGSIYQFLMEDKGLVLIATFGLPPQAHEDDALRGVHGAIAVESALSAVNIPTAIGIATGNSFCGIYGTEKRRQYTALGTPMNIAARLMQAARNGILCDVSTARQADKRREFTFQQLDPLQVKGSSVALNVYRPVANRPQGVMTDSAARIVEPLQTGLVGRAVEREALMAALSKLLNERTSSLIVLEGEAGLGKSRLIQEIIEEASAQGVTCLVGAGQAIEKSTSYHAWRLIFATVFGLANATESLKRRRERVLSQLAPDAVALSGLLNAVLPFEFSETEATRELQGEARAGATRHYLVRVLSDYLANEPAMLVLDDAHWFDSASWGLARLAAEQLTPALTVMATRATLEAPVSDYDALLQVEGVQRFPLKALAGGEVLQLVCQRLGVKTMLPPIAEYIVRQTEGNPLFIEELVYALRDSGAIEIRGTECRLGPGLANSTKGLDELFREMRLPDTMYGIITSRVDRFSPLQQMLLKVASVIGRSFSIAALQQIHPVEFDRARVSTMIKDLENQAMLRAVAADQYEFHHPMIQEVVYEAIPIATRRELHTSTAQWYEQTFGGNLDPYLALLAHHWRRAEVTAKAIEYSALAGEQALKQFAILEAVAFLSDAIQLDQAHGPATDEPSSRALRSHWELQLGSAYVSWSKYEEARQHLERGLALAGRTMPASAVKGSFALLSQVARQVGLRLRRGSKANAPDPEKLRLLELTRAYEGLMEIYYLTDKPVPCLYSVFRGLNLAEAAGPSAELARCYSSTAALLGFMAMRKYANAYFERAAAAAASAVEPSAQAWVLMTKGVYLAGLGEHEATRENLLQSIQIYDRLGDSRHGDDARANLAADCHIHSKFAESLELVNRLYASSLVRRDVRTQAEAARWRGYNLIALGRFTEVEAAIQELDSLRSSTLKLGGFHRKQDVAALTALLRLNQGECKSALEAALSAIKLMRGVSDSFEHLLERTAVAEVCFALARADDPEKQVREAMAECLKGLGKYARVFPIGRPARALYTAMSLRSRKPAKTRELLQECIKDAKALSMPLYEAQAYGEMANLLSVSEGERAQHRRMAKEMFGKIGASHRAEKLPSAL